MEAFARRRTRVWLVCGALLAAVACHGDAPVPVGADRLDACTARGLAPWEQTWLSAQNASSPWLAPWRAYQDTWPAGRLGSAGGLRFADDDPANVEARAPLVAAAGLGRYGLSVAWSAMDPEQPTRLSGGAAAALRSEIGALARHGLRPVIRLYASPSEPGPLRSFEAVLTEAAPAGARTVTVDASTAARLVPGRSGLDLSGFRAGWLVTSVDAAGRATLSRPLPGELAAGAHPASTLVYPPFSRPRLPDGRANPAFEEPFAGFVAFVRAVATEVRGVLGHERFDVSLWGEDVPPDVLEIDGYYEPAIDAGVGMPFEDTPVALRTRIAADLRKDFPGIGIGDGFADITTYAVESGSTAPVGLSARVRRVHLKPLVLPEQWQRGANPTLDARGALDGARGADGLWDPAFVPRYALFFPELPLSAVLESSWRPGQIFRDLSPLPTQAGADVYGRFAAPPGGRPIAIWVDSVALTSDVDGGSPMPAELRVRLEAKWALRALASYVGKGAEAVILNAPWVDPALPAGGPVLAAIGRFAGAFADASAGGAVDPIWLSQVTSCESGLQFAGDGTAAHPPLFNRDVVAAFPFRAGPAHAIVATYIMSRDVRDEVAPEPHRLTFENVEGVVKVDARDPLDDVPVPATIVERRGGRLTVKVPLRTWPILLHLRAR